MKTGTYGETNKQTNKQQNSHFINGHPVATNRYKLQ